MVLKLATGVRWAESPFENDVNMYGTQAQPDKDMGYNLFENDVNMYGTQAVQNVCHDRRVV